MPEGNVMRSRVILTAIFLTFLCGCASSPSQPTPEDWVKYNEEHGYREDTKDNVPEKPKPPAPPKQVEEIKTGTLFCYKKSRKEDKHDDTCKDLPLGNAKFLSFYVDVGYCANNLESDSIKITDPSAMGNLSINGNSITYCPSYVGHFDHFEVSSGEEVKTQVQIIWGGDGILTVKYTKL